MMRERKINKGIRKIAAALLMASILPCGLVAVGMPTFDIENWIYATLQYSKMLQDATNVVQGIMDSKNQFETIYEQVSSGDLDALSRNRYKVKSKLQKVSSSFDSMLNSAETMKSAVEGTEDFTVYWYEPEIIKDYINTFKQVGSDAAESIDEFNKEMASSSEDTLDSFDDKTESITSSASSQSASQQNAKIIEATAELKDTMELQDQTLRLMEENRLLKEEANRRAAEAELAYMIIQKKNLEAKWYEENRNDYFDNIDFSNFDV